MTSPSPIRCVPRLKPPRTCSVADVIRILYESPLAIGFTFRRSFSSKPNLPPPHQKPVQSFCQSRNISVISGIDARRLNLKRNFPSWSKMVVTALDELSKDGAFVRKESTFRNFITEDGSSGFPAVPGRYHLYISYACPWASRCYAFLKLKGLEDAIGLTVVRPKWQKTKEGEEHMGWPIAASPDEEEGATVDPINGAKTVRELYELADPSTTKFSVPVLWDKEKKTIVNNESKEITRMFNDEFNKVAKNPTLDLYPEELRDSIEEVNSWVYDCINNGVYKCGFATKQQPYEEAFTALFNALDKCEEILSKQRYIAGNILTEADIRLFVTLIRFDEVYVVHFKCNKRMIREYPNLFNYTKDVYQIPGIADTVNMTHIKKHYYASHPSINPYGVIPLGWTIDYSAPQNRDRFFK